MRYVVITAEELGHLREGLQVLDSLNEPDEPMVELYVYGLTDNANALAAVKEAVTYWLDEEIPEQDVNVNEAAFIIPVSTDTLYYLMGSGLMLSQNDEVAYRGGPEGPRTISLPPGVTRVRLTVGHFKAIALARDDYSAEDFLAKYGTKAQAAAPQRVERTEPAQAPAVAPETPAGAVAPKASSLKFNVEEWLD